MNSDVLDTIEAALSLAWDEITKPATEISRTLYQEKLAKIKVALAEVRRLREAGPQWEPVGDLYMQESVNRPIDRGGRLVVDLFVTSGRMIRLEDSDNNQISWLFRDDIRLCRRTQAGGQDGE